MYRTARGAFESFDETLAWSGKTLGLSDTFIFWRIRLPYCKQGIIAGTVLAFARALLYKPRWLFMDESTSALDEETEEALYQVLAAKLPGTTLVSVGHRSTLLRYHQRVLALDKETHTASLESPEKWEERLRAQ